MTTSAKCHRTNFRGYVTLLYRQICLDSFFFRKVAWWLIFRWFWSSVKPKYELFIALQKNLRCTACFKPQSLWVIKIKKWVLTESHDSWKAQLKYTNHIIPIAFNFPYKLLIFESFNLTNYSNFLIFNSNISTVSLNYPIVLSFSPNSYSYPSWFP